MRRRALAALLAAPLLLAACGGISPLRHRFEVGEDPYVLFAADGPEGAGDLYVVGPGGGRVVQVTFSPVDESAPALAPAGDVVAFLRRARADSVPQPWLLNLVNGAERKVPLPPGAGAPERLAWGVGGRELAIRTARGVWVTPAPPAPLALREAGAAERPGLDHGDRTVRRWAARRQVHRRARSRNAHGGRPLTRLAVGSDHHAAVGEPASRYQTQPPGHRTRKIPSTAIRVNRIERPSQGRCTSAQHRAIHRDQPEPILAGGCIEYGPNRITEALQNRTSRDNRAATERVVEDHRDCRGRMPASGEPP